MASKRKTFTLPPQANGKDPPRDDDPAMYAAFMGALLDGTIAATALIESRRGNGKLQFDYDDPNGP